VHFRPFLFEDAWISIVSSRNTICENQFARGRIANSNLLLRMCENG